MLSLFVVISIARGSFPSTFESQAKETKDSLIPKLQSSDPLQRADAFFKLRKLPGGFDGSEMANILLDLLERENKAMMTQGRQSQQGLAKESGISGEEYSEYYGWLLDECIAKCEKQNLRTPAALLGGSYGPGSPGVQQIIHEYGRQVLPILIQKSQSDLTANRHLGVLTLGTLVRISKDLPADDMNAIRKAVITLASDSQIPVRQAAAMTLGDIGDSRDIALLTKIANQDSAVSVDARGKGTYPVRDEAQRALQKIKQRTK